LSADSIRLYDHSYQDWLIYLKGKSLADVTLPMRFWMPKLVCDRCGVERPAEMGVMVSQNHLETNTLFGARAEAFVKMEAWETIKRRDISQGT
jgi:hypothetical protein